MNAALAEAMLIIPLVNHLAVFFAISYRLAPRDETGPGEKRDRTLLYKVTALFRGKRLRGLTRTLFIDGQRYIL
jgi:hypothetical protein